MEGSAVSGYLGSEHTVSLEPVFNQLYSLVLLFKGKNMPGLPAWVQRTRERMPLEHLQRNRLVMDGLFYAFTTEAALPSFGAYLEHLQALAPQSYQDRLLAMYECASPGECGFPDLEPTGSKDRSQILSSVNNYLAYLRKHFDSPHLDLDVEAQAYRYVTDPPAMKDLIITHLREMWETYLAPEWTMVRPMLSKVVDAFCAAGIATMSRREAIQFVIGKELPEASWAGQVDKAERIILAPSAHVGPYVGKFISGRNLVLLFGARLPEGVDSDVPDASRAEILTGLEALADDHRLQILRMAADAGELRATEVMTALDISQSAASRSLTQLTATGYLTERRKDGGKIYGLNPSRIHNTISALSRYLSVTASGT